MEFLDNLRKSDDDGNQFHSPWWLGNFRRFVDDSERADAVAAWREESYAADGIGVGALSQSCVVDRNYHPGRACSRNVADPSAMV